MAIDPQNELASVVRRVEQLRVEALALDTLPESPHIAHGLSVALQRGQDATMARPVCVAMLGGTGVGKSALFNALVGMSEASAVSNHVRPCTRNAIIAAAPGDRALLPDFGPADFVTSPVRDVVLIDTPDIDSVETAHRHCTRKVVDAADVVLYVASPDKRANFVIHEEILRWASRKRWFFAFNKTDTLQSDPETVRKDFGRQLEQLGFEPRRDVVFMLSATEPDQYDFERLRTALYSARTARQGLVLREDLLLRQFRHAITGDAVESLRARVQKAQGPLDGLRARVWSVYREALASTRGERVIGTLYRRHLWAGLSDSLRGPLWIPVFLRARAARLSLAWSVGRLAWRGPGLTTLLPAGWKALSAAVGGTGSLYGLFSETGQEHARRLREVALDAGRALDDLGLAGLSSTPESGEEVAKEGRAGDAAAWIPAPLRGLLTGDPSTSESAAARTELAWRLGQAIETSGEEDAAGCVRPRHRVWGNVLPAIVLFQVLLHLGYAWARAPWHTTQWLSMEFFLTAIAAFALSLLPGYWLVANAVGKSQPPVQDLADRVSNAIQSPEETGDMERIVARLQRFVRGIDQLDAVIQGYQEAVLAAELKPHQFGVSAEPRNPSTASASN